MGWTREPTASDLADSALEGFGLFTAGDTDNLVCGAIDEEGSLVSVYALMN